MSWSNGMAGLAHNMGHALGGFFHVTHGKSVGLYLPYNMEYLLEAGAGVYAEAARFIGLEGKTDIDLTSSLIAGIRDMARHLGQPLTVKELNIEKSAYEKALPQMVERAIGEASTPTVLRVPDEKDMERMFLYAYEGKTVDF
jgi:alcohol dehydrogenase class IV